MSPLLEVTDLAVRFDGEVDALRGVSFALEPGESLAIVGESGSGKSTLALCLAGLIQPPQVTGSVRVAGQELMGATPEVLRSLRWSTVALALQGAPFNPVVTVGSQVAEPLRERRGLSGSDSARRAAELAVEVHLDPALLERFPHELSGGERRRASLAMVLALDPQLVVLDEPTSGLDPFTREEVVRRIQAVTSDRGMAVIVVSHDLPDAANLAARTMVLYAGEAMEVGPSHAVMSRPAHPYSWALVNTYPVMTTTKDLRPIRGRPPDPRAVPSGCPYHPRCTQAEPVCWESPPPLLPSGGRLVACHFGGLKTLLAANGLSKTYRSHGRQVPAVKDVSFELREGESVGLIGPSGSGKSTLGRMITGQLAPDAGEILFQGVPMSTSQNGQGRQMRRRVQLVMQDPFDALSPRLSVEELVREPLDVARTGDRRSRTMGVAAALESVGLPTSAPFLAARTHQLSGGQLQRVSLARALVAAPKLLVADEPTSMLDASEQARLLVVLRERQIEMGLGLVLISHDMAVIRKVTDRIVVLDRGEVAESGSSEAVSSAPRSAAARRLIAAAPAFSTTEGAALDDVTADAPGPV